MGVSFDGSRNDVINGEYQAGTVTVGTSEILASVNGSTNLDNRQELLVYNASDNTIYFGPTGVTTSTGIPIEPNDLLNLPFGDLIEIYLIAGTAGNSVIIQEFS